MSENRDRRGGTDDLPAHEVTCPPRGHGDLAFLQSEIHLNSPAHQQRGYHCPRWQCWKEFLSLTALFNALESKSCALMRFERVQARVGQVLSGTRLIAF